MNEATSAIPKLSTLSPQVTRLLSFCFPFSKPYFLQRLSLLLTERIACLHCATENKGPRATSLLSRIRNSSVQNLAQQAQFRPAPRETPSDQRHTGLRITIDLLTRHPSLESRRYSHISKTGLEDTATLRFAPSSIATKQPQAGL